MTSQFLEQERKKLKKEWEALEEPKLTWEEFKRKKQKKTFKQLIVNEKTPNKFIKLVKARVMTRPKANTLDPQGVVVKQNLEKIGIKYLNKVSIGRYIEVELEEGPEEKVKQNVQEAIDKLLYNSIIEDYEVIYE